MKNIIVLLSIVMLASGCAYMRSETKDPVISVVSSNKVEVAYKLTLVRAYTLFDSQSALTKFRNTTGQVGNGSNIWSYAPGTSIGGLDQAASGTNFNDLVGTIVGAAVSAAKK